MKDISGVLLKNYRKSEKICFVFPGNRGELLIYSIFADKILLCIDYQLYTYTYI